MTQNTSHAVMAQRGEPRDSLYDLPSRRSKYGVIYADPPWPFRNWSAKGTGRNAVSHYDCMDLETLAALPVSDIAADDSVLFLWVTDPMLPRALELIDAWGFEFKTVGFYWVKLNGTAEGSNRFFTGLGYWTRANPEQCLLATRGKPQRRSKSVRRLVVERRREHSRKPDEIRDRIEKLVAGPYIELFARETKPGWDSWGDQLELFDRGSAQTRRQPSSLAIGGSAVTENKNVPTSGSSRSRAEKGLSGAVDDQLEH